MSEVIKCACGRPVVLPESREDSLRGGSLRTKCFLCCAAEKTTKSALPHLETWNEIVTEITAKQQMAVIVGGTLPKVNCSGLHLQHSVFLGCDLTTANFAHTDLSGAAFIASKLNNSSFANATMPAAILVGSQADYALFSNADMRGVLGGQSSTYDPSDPSQHEAFNTEYEKSCLAAETDEAASYTTEREVRLAATRLTLQVIDIALEHQMSSSHPESRIDRSLSALSCSESVFRATNLTGSWLAYCNLSGSGFDYTRLQLVHFDHADLRDTSFAHTSMGETHFNHALLSRADFTRSYTPDYDNGKPCTVDYSDACLEAAILRQCFFIKGIFHRVRGQRIDASDSIFGPGSMLTGDFANSRFSYAHFIGANLGFPGTRMDAIGLRDAVLSHATFTEVNIHTSDIGSALFDRTRFESHKELSQQVEADKDHTRYRDMWRRLETELQNTNHGKKRAPNSISGWIQGDTQGYISPPAMSFEGATLGEIDLTNILFLTANFENAKILLGDGSRCAFDSCSFDNSLLRAPKDQMHKDDRGVPFCQACTFTNAVVATAEDLSKSLFYGCAFSSARFQHVCSLGTEYRVAPANRVMLQKCAMERTDIAANFDTPGQLVLHQCRLLDGQYFVAKPKHPRRRKETEQETLLVLIGIVNSTLKFAKDALKNNKSYEYDEYREQQYLWNMFAQNFRSLALPNLESQCLINLRDVDLRPYHSAVQEKGCLARHKYDWLPQAIKTVALFVFALAAAALVGGLLGLFLDHWKVRNAPLWKGGIAGSIFVGLPLVLMSPLRDEDSTVRTDLRKQWRNLHIGMLWRQCGRVYAQSRRIRMVACWLGKRICKMAGIVLRWMTPTDRWQTRLSKAVYHYGELPRHAFYTWLSVIAIFGILYFVTGATSWCITDRYGWCSQFDIHDGANSIFKSGVRSSSLANCIYFSTVTFTTLGFGDLHPLHLTKVFAALEACIGAVLMALFVLSFARRTAARG